MRQRQRRSLLADALDALTSSSLPRRALGDSSLRLGDSQGSSQPIGSALSHFKNGCCQRLESAEHGWMATQDD